MNRATVVAEVSGSANEASLIARVRAGDRLAAHELYEAHAPRIFRLVHRLAGHADLAQDLTQETFIRAFERLVDFRGDAALLTWLHRIAVSVTLNALRKVKRHRRYEVAFEDEAQLEDLLAGASAATALPAEPDLTRRLMQEVDALPDALRVTLIMHDIEGYTHGEIAAVLEVPEGTCKTRLSAARVRLKQALAPFTEN